MAVSVGAAVALYPRTTSVALIGTFAILQGLWFASRLPNFFLAALGFLLIGYAFLGRGFAYLGFPPVFLGEVILFLGLLAALVGGGVKRPFGCFLSWLLMGFASWGAIRTIPYLSTYGFDALRDGALWGYSVFALLVASFLPRSGLLSELPERYERWLPWFLFWTPTSIVLVRLAGDVLPLMPGTDVKLLSVKPGDAAVHLAGAAVFLLVGLSQHTRRPATSLPWRDWFMWVLWLAGFFIVTPLGRSGLLAILAAIIVVLLFRPLSRWVKVIVLASVLAIFFVASDVEIELAGERKLSPQQVFLNIKSVFEDTSRENLDGSKSWRIAWWNHILDYTLYGNYFWIGKGFGINLAADDGFEVGFDRTALRSPHNGHLTILARAGIPGFLLWILLQGGFALALLRAYFRANRLQHEQWAKVFLWILAYWTAFMTNAAFDVFLEGPQGGIWFWSLIGFGIAALQNQPRGLYVNAPRSG
jgi:hypothetical protein